MKKKIDHIVNNVAWIKNIITGWVKFEDLLFDYVIDPINAIRNRRNAINEKKRQEKNIKQSLARQKLAAYIETAEYKLSYSQILKRINYVSIIITILSFIYFVFENYQGATSAGYFFFVSLFFCGVGYPTILLLLTLLVYAYTDFRVIQRRDAIEKHFSEFLHVVAANIRAGMTIDQALWRGARPQFGILSKEIEIIAKRSMTGQDLTVALREFGRKYDSKILRRSIGLLIEGINAGSEIGEILESLALNIEDIELRKQSMAANVTSYVIFIVFAVLFAAPALFAVATQLLTIVQKVGGKIGGTSAATTTAKQKASSMTISLSTDAISQGDFLIFCIVMLILTATMSTIIISVIKTGKATGAVREMPIYWVISVTLFLILRWYLGDIFANLL